MSAEPATTIEPVWNLFLRKIRAGMFEVVMPNDYGELIPVPTKETDDGYLVQWPVNPHSTGVSGIASMLREYDKFKGAEFRTANREWV